MHAVQIVISVTYDTDTADEARRLAEGAQDYIEDAIRGGILTAADPEAEVDNWSVSVRPADDD